MPLVHCQILAALTEAGAAAMILSALRDVPVIFMLVGYGMGYGVDDEAMTWMNEILQNIRSIRYPLLHSYYDPNGSFSTDGGVLFEKS
jgi:hypothetical protein